MPTFMLLESGTVLDNQEQASAQWDVLVTPIFGGTCLSGPLFYVR
jgi:hypothetical protein